MNKDLDIYDNRVKWQVDCDNVIKEKDNVILSSPTGSGKTGRYELWSLEKEERPIFITSPIKALSNQKFRQLQARGYKVGLETGDIKFFPYDDCDIICCTQEIYNNKYRNCKNCTLIVDEFSYIFDDETRARAYIDSLRYSEAKNIMICSATLGDTHEIREYINRLTGRDFFLYENKERLTTLEYKGQISKDNIKDSLVVTYSKRNCEIIAKNIYQNRVNRIFDINNKLKLDMNEMITMRKKQIFELSKKYGINNTELIELSTAGVAYYYGSLYPKEKLFIEELFEKRFIDTVVGTDALALGVNFPIQNVVFTQLIKYRGAKTREIGKNLFEQLSGRAGRKGFFDNGYVYYCDDFSTLINSNQESSEQINLKDLFNKLVNAQNEKVNISLNANIKDILLGNTTIEDEADFVSKFSTTDKDYEKERKRIDKTVKYVTSFDLATYYLKEILKLDIEQGFYKSMEHLSTKKQSKIERLSQSLFKLQPYFERDIGIVYLNEYSPKENCVIFLDILMETSLEKLFKRYGDTLYNLLIFRKYMNGLPKIYSKFYDLSIIDDRIDNMDYSVLHPNEFTLCPLSNEKLESNQTKNNDEKLESNKEKKNKKKLIYNVPRYLDKITINGREYVKLLVENKYILICQYYKTGNLKLFYVPLANTIYSISGVVKQKDILDILDRVDFSSIKHSQNETIEKIEGMKLSLKKNDYNLNYVHK